MTLSHMSISFLSLILLMHQDHWASGISLFSVVSTCVEGSVRPGDCWQSPASSPSVSPACWLLFDLLIIFLHFICHILVSLALQSSVTYRSGDCFFQLRCKKRLAPRLTYLLTYLACVMWHFEPKAGLAPIMWQWLDGPLCYLMLGIIKIFILFYFLFFGRMRLLS